MGSSVAVMRSKNSSQVSSSRFNRSNRSFVDEADREEAAEVLREIDDEDDFAELDDELPT
jgi:two-component sensor histidine kinase